MKIENIIVDESIKLGDNFDIELGNMIIESHVVGFMDDGVVVEADDKALALLGLGGALLESVDITEVSLGDYSKKAQISRALAQIEKKFYPEKSGTEQTIAKRTRGLERAKVRSDQARAEYTAKAQADALAKDRAELPNLEKQLAQLQAKFDPDYEYSDDHSVWSKNRDIKTQIDSLQKRITRAKGVAEDSLNELSSDLLQRAAQGAKDKRDQALDPEIHNALGGGYMNPLAKHYNATAEKFSDRATQIAQKEKIKQIASPAVMRKIGMQGVTEAEGEGKTVKNSLHTIIRVATHLERQIDNNEDFAEWVSETIGSVRDQMVKVMDYEISKKEQQGVAEGRMKEQMHTDAERMELAEFVDKYGDEDWVKEFWHNVNADINEAKYQGREVPLGKPMQGDVKKFKVYVKNKKGNVVKVNFGDPNMRIKKSNPARRKSFRARHRCATAKDRTSARYWSCRKW